MVQQPRHPLHIAELTNFVMCYKSRGLNALIKSKLSEPPETLTAVHRLPESQYSSDIRLLHDMSVDT